MPSKAIFRNAFLPESEDWVFVDSDWSSVELAYAAYKSGETPFLDAIKGGKDAHSMSAARVFKQKWIDAAEEGCIQLLTGKQCECPKHEKLRQMSKFTTFGLLFGSTHVGIADRLDISRTDAKKLVEDYFEEFPNLKSYFDANADYGMTNNMIKGAAPTNRIRFFHPPLNDGEKQAIGRQSMNMPIQGDCASMLKIALIKLRKYIIQHNFPAKLNLPVHDEILSSCHKDVKDEWLALQEQAMQEAVDMFTENGLIGTDSKILDRWTK